MGNFSNYLANELLDHIFKVGDYTAPTNIYIALSTADPGDDGSTISEPSGNNYARKVHNTWDTAASRATENTGAIEFNEATGSWGTITHVAAFDSLTGGNMLAHGALSASKAIDNGDILRFADGELDVSFASS